MRLYRYVVSSFYANPDWAHVFALTFFASCEDTIASSFLSTGIYVCKRSAVLQAKRILVFDKKKHEILATIL